MLQYLENKGISKYKFYKDNGISNGFLDKEGSIRSDICEKISYQYEDINLIWLITGKGEMLLKDQEQLAGVQETPTPYQQPPTVSNDVVALLITKAKILEELVKTKDKLIASYEQQLNIQPNSKQNAG